ncbi:U3 snoRNA associated [Seiridium cupressi]
MAPLTRRRKAAQDNSQDAGVAPPKSSATEATPKSTAPGIKEASGSPGAEKVTPKRQRLAVRVRDDDASSSRGKCTAGGEAKPALKPKRSRDAMIADSEDSDDGEPTPHQVTKQLEEDASQQLSHELKAAKPLINPASAPATTQSKRIVFGDDEDVEQYVAAAAQKAEKAQASAVEEDEGSDDEAPEAVTASAAVEESKKAAQAVVDAAEKQAATLKRKRQERDNIFREQAQKRKRAEKPKATTTKQSHGGVEGSIDEEISIAEADRNTTGRKRTGKFNLPSVLPAEFLTDSEDESEDERDLRVARKPKRIKFDDAVQTLSKEGRAPKDEIVGSTAYRVMVDQSDQKLAPRANHNSKSVKEMLMRRRRVGSAPTKAKGFFKRR